MNLKNKITLACSVTVLCFLFIISFQNCTVNPNLGEFNASSNANTCDAKIFTSTSTINTIFKVGDVINFSINSTPSNYTGQFLLKTQDGEIITNEPLVTPAFKQQIFVTTSDIGDYSYQIQLQDSSGKTTCQTAPRTFKIIEGNNSVPTCVLTVSGNGISYNAGEQVQFAVQSYPSGLETYITGQNLNSSGSVVSNIPRTLQGITPSSQVYTLTAADAGQWKRYAEVKASDGSFVVCQPSQIAFNIISSGAPVSPAPVVTPPPTQASGVLSSNKTTCYSLDGDPCGITLTWSVTNVNAAQVYETTNGVNYTYVGCGLSSTASVSHESISSSKPYTFKLYPTSDCNVRLTDAQIASTTPFSSVVVNWVYKSVDGCIPGKPACIPR